MCPRIGQIFALLVCLVLLPSFAQAQSVITGTIRDTSGGTLPGVTVEAASPALIEKVRTAVTDSVGQYRIIDLRPGPYTVTFSLPGFATAVREGIQLPGAFTLTLNVEMSVGGIEETVTVRGVSPLVDVQGTAGGEVLKQEVLAVLPSGRSQHSYGQMIVGVTMTKLDVGGNQYATQGYMSVHGLPATENAQEVDGISSVFGYYQGGSNPHYFPVAMIEEVVYQTINNSPEVTGGGVRVNVIPKDGGNTLHGSAFVDGHAGWVANNVTQTLRDRGFGLTPSATDMAVTVEGALGGPIKRNKLWFFADGMFTKIDTTIGGTYACDDCYGKATAPTSGAPAVDRQYLGPQYARVTWQMNPRNKLAAYGNHTTKQRLGTVPAGGDPATAVTDTLSPHWFVGSVKWTSTVSTKLMIEAGYAPSWVDQATRPRESIRFLERGSPEWYSNPSKQDLNLGTLWSSSQFDNRDLGMIYPTKVSASYVTGSHSFKTGVIYETGYARNTQTRNADLGQQYRSGVPDTVLISNTPTESKAVYRVFAAFVQDTWTRGRLTLNPGIRWESVNGGHAPLSVPSGRFADARTVLKVDDLPNWKTFAPRFGAAYDVFGNGKTALKLGLNRYDQLMKHAYALSYHPMSRITTALSWRDLNGDDIAQGERGCVYLTPGCEINLAQMPTNFGVRSLNTPDPNAKRPYYLESNFGVQHELTSNVLVSGTWIRTTYRQQIYTYNTLLTANDYTPVKVVSPLDGSEFTVYNLNRSKLGRVANFDTNDPTRKRVFNGIQFDLNIRLGGATLAGGAISERILSNTCTQPDNPNAQLFCDDTKYDIPWLTQVKFHGSYPLPWAGLQVSAVFNSYSPRFTPNDGTAIWLISPSTRYAANCLGPCTPGALVIPNMTLASLAIPLTPRNTQTLDRTNQFDISVAKVFRTRKTEVRARLDVYNVANVSAIQTVRSSNYGTAAYLQPALTIEGRTIKAGIQMSF